MTVTGAVNYCLRAVRTAEPGKETPGAGQRRLLFHNREHCWAMNLICSLHVTICVRIVTCTAKVTTKRRNYYEIWAKRSAMP